MNDPTPGFRIRFMTLTDVDGVVALASSLPEAPRWSRAAYEACLAPHAAVRRLACVAEEATTGVLAGFAIASLNPPESELESIVVAATLQRRGLGRRLWSFLVSALAERGASETFLEVRASNRRALDLYRSLGFAEAGGRPRYYADPAEDAVILRCILR
jgi:ribosomal-protein-alanine acetyltransferase